MPFIDFLSKGEVAPESSLVVPKTHQSLNRIDELHGKLERLTSFFLRDDTRYIIYYPMSFASHFIEDINFISKLFLIKRDIYEYCVRVSR